jgi:DNA-binding response OmpR family regulator
MDKLTDPGRNTIKVLIIDDSAEDRFSLKRMIQECKLHEHEISEAETAYDGLVIARLDNWDVIFLDLNLPDITGLDFLAEYRKDSPKVVLPVVMLTGKGRESVAVDAMKRGAFDYAVKSEITPERVAELIHDCLAVAAARRKEEQEALERMRAEDDLKVRQVKAAELYAISVTTATYNQELRGPLGRLEVALESLLDGAELGESERRQILRQADETVGQIRETMSQIRKLDLFGMLRLFGRSDDSTGPSSNGAGSAVGSHRDTEAQPG